MNRNSRSVLRFASKIGLTHCAQLHTLELRFIRRLLKLCTAQSAVTDSNSLFFSSRYFKDTIVTYLTVWFFNRLVRIIMDKLSTGRSDMNHFHRISAAHMRSRQSDTPNDQSRILHCLMFSCEKRVIKSTSESPSIVLWIRSWGLDVRVTNSKHLTAS